MPEITAPSSVATEVARIVELVNCVRDAIIVDVRAEIKDIPQDVKDTVSHIGLRVLDIQDTEEIKRCKIAFSKIQWVQHNLGSDVNALRMYGELHESSPTIECRASIIKASQSLIAAVDKRFTLFDGAVNQASKFTPTFTNEQQELLDEAKQLVNGLIKDIEAFEVRQNPIKRG